MTYIMYPSTGEVVRSSDNKVVAPCQSVEDPDYVAYIDWVHAGNSPECREDPAQVAAVEMELLVLAIQERLDAVARSRNYDGILSLCTYATSAVPRFRTEGQAGVDWRDQCWAIAYEVLAEVQSGTRAVPTEDEFMALLPAINW